MKKHTPFLYLYLFLAGALLLWSGCDPEDEDPAVCNDNVPQLNYSDYCDQDPLEFSGLGDPGNDFGLGLPSFCASDYTNSRIMKVDVPAGNVIYLHQFFNFPGSVTTEFIATNCNGNYDLINDCGATETAIEAFSINASDYTTVYIRVVYEGTPDYVPGQRESDKLIFAGFSEAFMPQTISGRNGQRVPLSCDGTTTNRIILTPSTPDTDINAIAEATGLPIQSCDCADGNLLTLEAPAGVDLNISGPIIREKSPDVDTVKTTPDFVIFLPPLNFTDQPDPANESYIAGNPCLDYNNPVIGSATLEPVIVTIVDSGADIDNFGNIFNPVRYLGGGTSCVPLGVYGADLLNADEFPEDQIGHGTAVATAFLSGYKSASPLYLLNNKFFGPDGGTLFDALCASYAGLQAGTDILNLSWGFQSPDFPPALEGLLDATKELEVIVVASAGNDTRNNDLEPYWPATAGAIYDNVITVGSYEAPGGIEAALTFWSSFGQISTEVAAFFTTKTKQFGGGEFYPIGTSISAPIVSRRLAQLRSMDQSSSANFIIERMLIEEALMSGNLFGLIDGGRYIPLPDPTNGCELGLE